MSRSIPKNTTWPEAEYAEVARAAELAGVPFSVYVRAASLAKARGTNDLTFDDIVARLREMVERD